MPRRTSSSTSSSAPGSSGASVTRRTGPAASSRSSERRVRVAPCGRQVRAEAARGEEGPFQVGAENARAAEGGRQRLERLDEIGLGRRDERRQVGGDAGLEQSVAGDGVAVGVRTEEVDTREAVHLQVDETGRRDATATG